MKTLYLDTNIIIAFLKKGDNFNEVSNKIMNSEILERVGSAITIIEIASIISRQFEEIEFDETKTPNWDTLTALAKKALVTSYFLNILPIKFYFNVGNENYVIRDLIYKIHVDFTKAIQLSTFFSLKGLDNLQIASALNLRDIQNVQIDYFVTTDTDILNQAEAIQGQTNLTVIHPEKLAEIEYL